MDELDSKLRNLEELEAARAKEAWEKHVVSTFRHFAEKNLPSLFRKKGCRFDFKLPVVKSEKKIVMPKKVFLCKLKYRLFRFYVCVFRKRSRSLFTCHQSDIFIDVIQLMKFTPCTTVPLCEVYMYSKCLNSTPAPIYSRLIYLSISGWYTILYSKP